MTRDVGGGSATASTAMSAFGHLFRLNSDRSPFGWQIVAVATLPRARRVTVQPRRRLRPTPAVRAALLVASAGIAAALAALVWSQLPEQLNVRTDIVGYPEAANFNIERYFWAYGLVAGLFPFLTLALYLIARRTIAPGTAQPLGVIALFDRRAPAASGDRVSLAVSAGRIILVGIILGFEIAIGGGWQDFGGIVLAVTATAYGLAVALIAAVAVAGPLRDRELDTVLAGVNAVLATLTVLGLAWVSSGTKVTVSSDGTVHHYPWFPWWLGALVTAAAPAIVLRALRGSVSAKRVERRLLLLLVAPVLLFLFVAVLPGGAGDMDSFHEGEQLGAAHLTAAGRFPWRDLLFIHGPLGDVLQPLLSIHVFGDTRWGEPRRRGSAVQTSRGGRALPALRLPLPRQLALPRRHAGCDPDRLGVHVPGAEHPPPASCPS